MRREFLLNGMHPLFGELQHIPEVVLSGFHCKGIQPYAKRITKHIFFSSESFSLLCYKRIPNVSMQYYLTCVRRRQVTRFFNHLSWAWFYHSLDNDNDNDLLTDPLGGSSLLNYINYNYKINQIKLFTNYAVEAGLTESNYSKLHD